MSDQGGQQPGKGEASGDLRKRAFGALGTTSIIVMVDRVAQIGLMVILARLISPEQTAVAAAAGLVIGMTGLICSWGLMSALIQTPKLTVEVEAVARTILILSSIIALAFLELAAPLSAAWFRNPDVADALRVGAIVVLAQAFSSVAFAQLLRNLRARDAALADLLSSLCGTACVTIPMAFAGFGFWSLMFGSLAQVAARAIMLCLLVREPIKFGSNLGEGVRIWRKGMGFMLNSLLNRGGSDAPRWLIGRYLPTVDLGLYSRANGLMGYPATLFTAMVERVAFPAVALVQSEPLRLRKGVKEAVELTALVGLPLTVALFLLGPDLIRVLLGPAWEGAVEPFRILSLATYFRIADRLNWAVLRGLGRTSILSLLQVVCLIILVGACMLGSRYGLRGVSAAVVGVMTFSYIAMATVAMSSAKLGPGEWVSAHGPGLASGVLVLFVLGPTIFLLHGADFRPVLVLAVCVVISVAVMSLALMLAPGLFLGAAGLRLVKMAGLDPRDWVRKSKNTAKGAG